MFLLITKKSGSLVKSLNKDYIHALQNQNQNINKQIIT